MRQKKAKVDAASSPMPHLFPFSHDSNDKATCDDDENNSISHEANHEIHQEDDGDDLNVSEYNSAQEPNKDQCGDDIVDYKISNMDVNGTDSSSTAPSHSDNNHIQCFNCYRSMNHSNQNDELPPCYYLQLAEYPKEQIRTRKKFCNFRQSEVPDTVINIILCKECSLYLIGDTNELQKEQLSHAWPSFVWNFLSCESLHEGLGRTSWKYIPKLWREFWIDAVQERIPTLMDVSLDDPIPYFLEITGHRKDFQKHLDELLLGNLMKAIDKYLLPTVKCPWGCSEYIHKVGIIPYNIIMQRYNQQHFIAKMMSPKSLLQKANSA